MSRTNSSRCVPIRVLSRSFRIVRDAFRSPRYFEFLVTRTRGYHFSQIRRDLVAKKRVRPRDEMLQHDTVFRSSRGIPERRATPRHAAVYTRPVAAYYQQ